MRTSRMQGLCVGLLVGAVLMSGPVPAYAEEDVSGHNHCGRKLCRGVGNTLFGWMEVPLYIRTVSEEESAVAGICCGTVIGLGRAVGRTLIGVVEIATFPFPMPNKGYGPLIEPEFVDQYRLASAAY